MEEEQIILDLIKRTQQQLDSAISPRPKRLSYKQTVVPIISKLARELRSRKVFPLILETNNLIDAYVESCALLLIYEYLGHLNDTSFSIINDSIVPFQNILQVLEVHPYLLSIIQHNQTYEEWEAFKENAKETFVDMYGERADVLKSKFEKLIEIKDIPKDKISSLQYFHYLIGFYFEDDKVSIKYKDLIDLYTDSTFVIIHLSHNVKDLKSIVTYNVIPSIRRNLILNPEKVESLKYIKYPETVVRRSEPYEIANHETNNKTFIPVLCYDDNKNLEECTFTPCLLKHALPIEFMNRFINGATVSTLSETHINNYFQQWFFEKFQDHVESRESLIQVYTKITTLAAESYNPNPETCIKNILSHRFIDDLFTDKLDRDMFFTYANGIRLLPLYNKTTVIRHFQEYFFQV